MKPKEAKPTSTLLYLGSVAFIILAIAVTAIFDRLKAPSSSEADIRARAGTQANLKMTGVVAEINDIDGVVLVDNVQFAESNRSGSPKSLGTWTVTPPPTANLASLFPGSTITMTIDPQSFLATSRTMTATEIRTQR